MSLKFMWERKTPLWEREEEEVHIHIFSFTDQTPHIHLKHKQKIKYEGCLCKYHWGIS